MMKPPSITTFVCLCLPLLAPSIASQNLGELLPTPFIPQEADPIAQYEKYMERLPFVYHTWGRTVLARTRTDEALALLLEDYRKPPANEEFARYTMSELFGKYFDRALWADPFAQLRKKHDGPGDMWMWVNTLALSDDAEDTSSVLQLIRESKSVLHKAAAIEALTLRGREAVIDVIPEVCATFPRKSKPGERRLLIGALSGAILANKGNLSDPRMQKATRAYINLLAEDVGLTHSASMVVSRHLARTFGINQSDIAPEPWIRLLERTSSSATRPSGTRSQLRFFGIEAKGDRICYVIDMSNSMLEPIDPELLKKGPVTGPRKRGQIPDENDIPWHKIKTRFDLAREHLKISIQRLSDDKRFCVVWFGDDSDVLRTTPGLIKATRSNVSRVVRELDAIEAGPLPPNLSVEDAPYGYLKGKTNLHGGLVRAFSMRAKGMAHEHGYIDLKSLAEGCDTIFLISDGAPSFDDFDVVDVPYDDVVIVRDGEYGRRSEAVHDVTYPGPMVYPSWVYAELRRLNAFRKVPVHCVGIGEADIKLLRALAEVSHGEVYVLGAKASTPVKKPPR